jgi:selenocysteine-specific elongation factor
LLHGEVVAAIEAQITARVGAEPVAREAVRAALPSGLPSRAFDAIVAGLARRGALIAEGDTIRPAGGTALPRLGPLEEDLVGRFRAWKLEAPRPAEVAGAVGKPDAAVKAALDRLLAHKLIVKVKPDLYLDAALVGALRERLVAHLDAHGEITPQEWKDITGASRKYSSPLAEFFDAEKVTLRVGEIRKRRR